MKRVRLVLAAVLAMAVLAGCSLLQASLRIVNDSSYTVEEVVLSPSYESSTSDYRMTATILPGSTYTFEDIWSNTFDIAVTDTAGGRWECPTFTLGRGGDYDLTLRDEDRIAP